MHFLWHFSINYTRYCHTIKLSIIIIRFRDIFKLVAIISKKKFRFLIFICLESFELGAYILSFCLFFRLFFSLLSSLPLILSSPFLCSPLLFTTLLSSSLLYSPLIFSSLLFFLLLSSSLLFSSLLFCLLLSIPLLFSSLPLYFSSLRLILQPVPFFPNV